ncbi:hypothetical protein B0186_07520 [Canicola haemoglobinophilus]|uniref:Uncharacterized protein n=1 Tax=Canicola haemoglobinophilus TaxID=733 RepID=A0A1V4B064_9PAST|nr:hypothetical protein [Canicola haemoglobinophilus]OOR99466.1 hypothetical protein B0186_07520 [Canicola haemoglobinophilus]STO59754.1 Uncharacterised protein [Canicola haemoglobinophilus]
MSKEYEFKIMARMEGNRSTSLYIIVARNEREARNKFKANFVNASIVSCVRGCERTKQNEPKNMSTKKNSESEGSNNLVLGVAGLVGGFLLSKVLGNKDK